MAPRIGKRSAKNSSSNPLAQRLDSTKIKPSSSSSKDNNNNNNKRKPYDSNPLLARLSEIGNRKSSGSNNNSNENPLAQRIRNGKFVPPSITSQTQALQNQRLRKSAPSKTPEGKITKRSKSASNNNNNNIRNGSSKTILKIRNASNPNFLKIKNLEYGTNIRDLKVVLESIGKTKSIKIKDLESGSALAEVIFVSEATLEKAHTQLNGAIADGRTLRTEITSDSEIFNGAAVDSYPNGPRSMRR